MLCKDSPTGLFQFWSLHWSAKSQEPLESCLSPSPCWNHVWNDASFLYGCVSGLAAHQMEKGCWYVFVRWVWGSKNPHTVGRIPTRGFLGNLCTEISHFTTPAWCLFSITWPTPGPHYPEQYTWLHIYDRLLHHTKKNGKGSNFPQFFLKGCCTQMQDARIHIKTLLYPNFTVYRREKPMLLKDKLVFFIFFWIMIKKIGIGI